MKTMSRLSLVAALALVASPALALTVGGSFNVTANVTKTCSFQTAAVPDLAFGTYDPYGAAPGLDADTFFQFRCNNKVFVQVQIGQGGSYSGGRRMAGGTADFLRYDLYQDAGRNTLWGNTVGTDTWDFPMPNGNWFTKWIYGRIPSGQDPSPGNYADNAVTITVNY
jgi:spore coat protein U-like protein